MIAIPEVVLSRISAVAETGGGLAELAVRSARSACAGDAPAAVVAATFSNPVRFPSLAVRVASALGLPASTPALDLQMACSAYPYALYLAARLSADLRGPVLVVDGDVQSPFVDAADHATAGVFSDACTSTVVSCAADAAATSPFDFLSRHDDALSCASSGPIRMDGFKVFTFVATEVVAFLRAFIDAADAPGADFFVPHQANAYMIRQLADALRLKDRLLALDGNRRNPGSCSIPFALAAHADRLPGAHVLLAGFGAGYSASAARVRLADDFKGTIE